MPTKKRGLKKAKMKKRVNIWISDEFHDQVSEEAERDDRPLGYMIRVLAKEGLRARLAKRSPQHTTPP